MKTRANEAEKTWFRANRYYHTEKGWWIQTREKIELGPFTSHMEAEDHFDIFIEKIKVMENKSDDTITRASEFDSFVKNHER